MSIAPQLLQQTLALDEEERAALALQLLDSLSPTETRDEAAWIAEIERRARRALSGDSPAALFEDAVARMERDLAL